MTTGEKLFSLRTKFNYTQEQIAEKLNVSRQSVSKWEQDQSIPDIDNLIILSEIYQVSIDYLLRREVKLQEEINANKKISNDKRFKKGLIIIIAMFIVKSLFYYWPIFNINVIEQGFLGFEHEYMRLYSVLSYLRENGLTPNMVVMLIIFGIGLCQLLFSLASYYIVDSREDMFVFRKIFSRVELIMFLTLMIMQINELSVFAYIFAIVLIVNVYLLHFDKEFRLEYLYKQELRVKANA